LASVAEDLTARFAKVYAKFARNSFANLIKPITNKPKKYLACFAVKLIF